MAYNFLNSPPGPLGAAGQSSVSTLPQNIFANGSPQFNNLGSTESSVGGKPALGDRMQGIGERLQAVFSKLFGGDGNLPNGQGIFNNGLPPALGGVADGVSSIPGNLAAIPQGVASIPSAMASIFSSGPRTASQATPAGLAPTGTPPAPQPQAGPLAPTTGNPGSAGAPGAGVLSQFMQGRQQ